MAVKIAQLEEFCTHSKILGGYLHVYPRTPDSSEGLIPRAIIWYKGIDP